MQNYVIKLDKELINKTLWRSFLTGTIFISMFLFTNNAQASFVDPDFKEPPISIADRKIKEAGIPIDGLSGWPVQRIDFKPEATQAQQQQAWDIVNSFDYQKELKAQGTMGGLITAYGSSIPNLTADGQISIAEVNGYPYIYFRANGVTQHILGASSFEVSPNETTDVISGEKMEVGDFVIGMIDKNLENGATPEESSLHGTWVKWNSVKKQLLEEIKETILLSPLGVSGSGAIEGVNADSIVTNVKNTLVSLGITIKEGLVHIVNLAVENFTAKIANIEKLQMVDRATGQIYCTWIENGQWQKSKGECDSSTAESEISNSDIQNQNAGNQAPKVVGPESQITTSDSNSSLISQPDLKPTEELIPVSVLENQEPEKPLVSEPEPEQPVLTPDVPWANDAPVEQNPQ